MNIFVMIFLVFDFLRFKRKKPLNNSFPYFERESFLNRIFFTKNLKLKIIVTFIKVKNHENPLP